MNDLSDLLSTIQIRPAPVEQKAVLANLLELYTYDFCDFLDLEIRPDGRFGYKDLDLYWTDADRHPFLMYVEGRLAGLVLMRRIEPSAHREARWDMAEFFVLRWYRRRGIGTSVAHEVFRRFPGAWEVRVMDSNRPAHRFWKEAVSGFVGATVESTSLRLDGKDWQVFSFESRNG